MKDADCVHLLQWALPNLRMRWPGFRKVRRQVGKRIDRRLRQLRLEDVWAYRDYLNLHPQEWAVLDTLCRISISRFYRDRHVFNLLRDRVLPSLAEQALARGDKLIHVWSAGCASGEEVYSIKLVWELGPLQEASAMRLHLTATDADSRLLDRARRGCYPHSSIRDLPHEWLPLAFDRLDEELCVRARFRSDIQFMLQDIRQQMPAGPFDLICCRHLVFTYFDEALQSELLQQILARLGAGGVLVLGKQEALPPRFNDVLQPVQRHSGCYWRLMPNQMSRWSSST